MAQIFKSLLCITKAVFAVVSHGYTQEKVKV